MERVAKITSDGQITVPKAVRDALGVGDGDSLVFCIQGTQAIVTRAVDLIDLAGSVSVPVEVRRLGWKEVRQRTWLARGRDVERIEP
jgi:antitoxin PrlF